LRSLAWFSPWPPQRSGIAGRSADVVAHLTSRGYAIDVFVDEQDRTVAPLVTRASNGAPASGELRVQSAHDFVWRQAHGQYDLAVYQLGNSRLHEFIWPYLFRWPGLVVLHDARLHHARGRSLLRHERSADYRAEFAWNHPDVPVSVAELGIAGFDGTYYYQWPMVRSVIESARVVASHTAAVIDDFRRSWPDRPMAYIALGEGPETFDAASARAHFRARHAIAPEALTFGVFGGMTAEKRLPQILRAFAATRAAWPTARLLLAGGLDPLLDLPSQIASLRLTDAVCLATSLDDESFDAAIAAVDVGVHLRWPTALETSGPWLRSLALSRPTVVIDLAHQPGVPSLDPRTWRRHAPCEDSAPDADAQAVTVAIDILDEDHSLRLAMRRLASDAGLRDRLGAAGRRFWEREHGAGKALNDYERAIAMAINQPVPTVDLPQHMRPDAGAYASRILTSVGLDPALLTRRKLRTSNFELRTSDFEL
jgi:glycosyltransferase involved in cell wall biosynthesis